MCFHKALRNRCRDLTHPTKLIIFKSPLDFGISVHYKRAAADHRLDNGFSFHHQKPGGHASRYVNAASGPRENGEVAFRGISLAIHGNFTTQDEKGTCMPKGLNPWRGRSTIDLAPTCDLSNYIAKSSTEKDHVRALSRRGYA